MHGPGAVFIFGGSSLGLTYVTLPAAADPATSFKYSMETMYTFIQVQYITSHIGYRG